MSFGFFTAQVGAICGEVNPPIQEGIEIETELFITRSLPETKGQLMSEGKAYLFSQKPTSPSSLFLSVTIQETGPKTSLKAPVFSPMHLATLTYQREPLSTPSPPKASSFLAKEPTTLRADTSQPFEASPRVVKPIPIVQKGEARTEKGRGHERKTPGEKHSTLNSQRFSKEETRQWWEERYHKRERDGQKQGGEGQQQHHADEEKKKIGAVCGSNNPRTASFSKTGSFHKPVLEHPKTGIFALYYILTKIGIFSDGTSNFSYKKEIESINEETTHAHKKRLDEMKIALEKEQSAARWGIAAQVFSWLGSMMAILTGVALIISGVGAIAGALIIAGGVIQVTNQLLELTGGWKKIAELLPSNDPEKKRAVVTWMQIGVAVLCLIISGIGIVWGGFANIGEASSIATIAFGGIIQIGHGVATIGEGISQFLFKNKLSDVKKYDKILASLKHKRQDLMEKVAEGIDRLEQLFEDLARSLEFETELFKADQMVNR